MATIKSHTDLPQSKELAKFLSHESADMHYIIMGDDEDPQSMVGFGEYIGILPTIPCWSLAALVDVLESEIDGEEGETYELNIEKDGTWWNVWYRERYDEASPIEIESTEELIDACYEMILKLHELKML